MGILEAIILGIIQGLTEFLPVSSSGHLEIGKALFGNTATAEQSMQMTVILHFATALSTIIVFRSDIKEIVLGLFKWEKQYVLFCLYIIISMIPAVFVGLLFEEELENLFDSQLLLVGIFLLITALLLLLADRAKNTNKKVGYFEAIIVGLAQAVAILPGVSRSGATIATSVMLGIDREKAARFSFLMVVPLILGKISKDLLEGDFSSQGAESNIGLLAGFIAAFIAGIFACKVMISLVKRSKLYYFSIYCTIVGLITIFISLN